MDRSGKVKSGTLMTEGPIAKQIVFFALPLLIGNVFQQLYNTVDSVIVGQFVGSDALAAVGSSGSIVNLIVSLLMGITLGSSVVISNYYGARDLEHMERAIHTSISLGLISGALISIVGVILSPQILIWMGTPADVLDQSALYLRIIFLGMIGSMSYNVGGSIFRAVGDSRHPLYYLIFASITNVVLDLLFVVVFKMGIAGAAWATIISQFLSAILTFAKLMKDKTEYQVSFKKIRIYKQEALLIIKIGIPSGIQNSVIALSNVVVQSNINSFGPAAMAGCGAYVKLDGFAVMPAISFGMALTTFVGQNLGAGKPDRMQKGAKFGILASMITVEIAGIFLFIFAKPLISLFDNNPEVISYGVQMARTNSLFYMFLAGAHAMAGALRGAGKTKVPMYVMLACWCLMRMTWITVMIQFIHDIHIVFMGYPITWIASMICFVIYYKKSNWVHKSGVSIKA